MFYPSASNSEFIELFNFSDSTIDLFGFQLKYHTSSADKIVSLDSNYLLLPDNYALILEADYDFESGIYKKIIPKEALIFTLDDNAFGSSGMANTSDRSVYLLNSANDTIDVYTYSANNKKGFSDELIIQDNMWENSKIINGTPGFKNSVSPVQFDLAITKFSSEQNYFIIGNNVDLSVVIKNLGSEVASDFKVNVYKTNTIDTLIYSNEFYELNTLDSININLSLFNLGKGNNDLKAIIEFDKDEFLANDTSYLSIKGISINENYQDLVINEIMYAPKNSEPEWVEIFNRSEKVIDLTHYQLADNSDTAIIFNKRTSIYPNSYFVISDDSTIISFYNNIENLAIYNFPTLNNSGDDIKILDSLNRVIDSLSYETKWGGSNGKSIERIKPFGPSSDLNNWREAEFPTPGKINSVTQKNYDLVLESVFTNPTIPLIGTKIKFVAKIKNVGKNSVDFLINLYDDINKDSLADNWLESSSIKNLGRGDSLNFEFSFESTVLSEESNFIFNIIAEDDDTTNNKYIFNLKPAYPKFSVLVNEIMYAPANYEPEWVELYNNSDYDINLEEWSIGDILAKPVFKSFERDFTFPSKSYLVIAKSNTIYESHRNINSPVIELPFANLNNDEDGVVLKDNRKRTMDSLKYFDNWGGAYGKSIERISLNFGSTNSNNWKSSFDIEGSTPGRINSNTPKDYDLSLVFLSTEPKFPIEQDEIQLVVKINNFGKFDAESFALQFVTSENGRTNNIEILNELFLAARDSVILKSSKRIKIQDTLEIAANIIFSLDQDILNNYNEKIIIPGFNKNTVLINEIMFKPSSGEPEWVELINNSDSIVNISNWQIGDLSNKSIISAEDRLLNPNDYIVLSDYYSSSYFNTNINVVQTDLPNLGNTKDAVILYDFRNAIIDSAYYSVASDFRESTSLERIQLESKSSDPQNWTFSLDQDRSSPGRINSTSLIPDNTFGDVIISEIMFKPSNTNSEYLELFNTTNHQIEMGGWKIEGENSDLYNFLDQSFYLDPGDYFVVAADSSILLNYQWLQESNNISILNSSSLGLSNTEERLYLKDIKNKIVDSLKYSSSWENSALVQTKNISIEIIDPRLERNKSSNWSSCVSELGGTPGLVNSIKVENLATKAKLKISPNPFSPDNDGFEDFTFINYNLTQKINQIRVRIFDSKGRFVRSIANNKPAASHGTIIFNGMDDDNKPLKIGIYIILFEAVNSDNAVVDVIKDVFVVARKL